MPDNDNPQDPEYPIKPKRITPDTPMQWQPPPPPLPTPVSLTVEVQIENGYDKNGLIKRQFWYMSVQGMDLRFMAMNAAPQVLQLKANPLQNPSLPWHKGYWRFQIADPQALKATRYFICKGENSPIITIQFFDKNDMLILSAPYETYRSVEKSVSFKVEAIWG